MTLLWAVLAGTAVVALALFVGVPFFFNRLSPTVDARRRSKDDGYFFAECSTGRLTRFRRLNGRLPSDPRCRLCLVPFRGVGRVLRVRPSRKNPNYCMGCFEMAPLGGSDMEVGVLFADLRGFTAWSETHTPEEVERALNRFYEVTTKVITHADGLVDKLVGDEVMGLFLTTFASLGDRTCDAMMGVAEDIVRRLRAAQPDDDSLPVGIGVTFGVARVGNVGAGEVKDFTAVGDVVNTAARLQGCAQPGQIVMAEEVYERVHGRYPHAVATTLELKGKSDAVAVRVLSLEPTAS